VSVVGAAVTPTSVWVKMFEPKPRHWLIEQYLVPGRPRKFNVRDTLCNYPPNPPRMRRGVLRGSGNANLSELWNGPR
jgi:hypothetical protein